MKPSKATRTAALIMNVKPSYREAAVRRTFTSRKLRLKTFAGSFCTFNKVLTAERTVLWRLSCGDLQIYQEQKIFQIFGKCLNFINKSFHRLTMCTYATCKLHTPCNPLGVENSSGVVNVIATDST